MPMQDIEMIPIPIEAILTADSFVLVLLLLIITAIAIYFMGRSFGKILLTMISQFGRMVDAINDLAKRIDDITTKSYEERETTRELINSVTRQTEMLVEMKVGEKERRDEMLVMVKGLATTENVESMKRENRLLLNRILEEIKKNEQRIDGTIQE